MQCPDVFVVPGPGAPVVVGVSGALGISPAPENSSLVSMVSLVPQLCLVFQVSLVSTAPGNSSPGVPVPLASLMYKIIILCSDLS